MDLLRRTSKSNLTKGVIQGGEKMGSESTSNINALRITSFFAGNAQKGFKQLMIVQELYQREQKQGCPLLMLHKVKRFQSWIDYLIEHNFIDSAFFDEEVVMVKNDFFSFNPEAEGLKEKLIQKENHFESGKTAPPVKETIVLDLSGFVFLTVKWTKGARKVGDLVNIPVRVGETNKADSYDFNKLLVYEAFQREEWGLPEPPDKAEGFEIMMKLEFAPDNKKNFGDTIQAYEIQLLQEGVDPIELAQ